LTGVHRSEIRFRISIHESADLSAAEIFWADAVGIAAGELARATLKRHNATTTRRNVGSAYHGCLIVTVAKSATIYRTIEGLMGGIDQAARTPALGGGQMPSWAVLTLPHSRSRVV